MTKRMLIDTTQPEETRVAVVSDKILEGFYFETSSKRNLRGTIYLAKIVRVEPSLQAAFVEYGNERNGFLPFSEINPEYFRIPVSDRQELVKQESEDDFDPDQDLFSVDEDGDLTLSADPASLDIDVASGETTDQKPAGDPTKTTSPYRQYKIQEVISKGKVMLLQMVKDERGQKGAAFTSYISLAGRYCVFMPNARRGNGVSRKIPTANDRTRLKNIINSFGLEPPMSLIVRTAGQGRNKTELKRDADYLTRLWNEILNKALHSAAPALIHQEGNLIQRSVRDLYSKDIEEIYVCGKEGYSQVKAVMKSFMPSHVRRVKEYTQESKNIPCFLEIDDQIEALYASVVQLPSGGSLVISPTEALTAIDINSGKHTCDRHIDETAYHTNLEAAQEICRQLTLRDIGGLVVVDFIDMENRSYLVSVERKMKELLSKDKAHTQCGRISSFGLYELSRQRTGPNFLESSTHLCQHCEGWGRVKTPESQSIRVLRQLEKVKILDPQKPLQVWTQPQVAQYLLNKKRILLLSLEEQLGFAINICGRSDLKGDCLMDNASAEQDDKPGKKKRYRRPKGKNDDTTPQESKRTPEKRKEKPENDNTTTHVTSKTDLKEQQDGNEPVASENVCNQKKDNVTLLHHTCPSEEIEKKEKKGWLGRLLQTQRRNL